MNLFLDVKRRRVDNESAPVLFILATPDKLRIKIAVASLIGHANRALLGLLHHRLIFGRGNVLTLCVLVFECLDSFSRRSSAFWCFGHAYFTWPTACITTDSIILLNSLWT